MTYGGQFVISGRIQTVYERIETAFWQWGWLLPAALPFTQVGGRALFNVIAYLYLLWALLVVPSARVRPPLGYVVAWLCFVAVVFLGSPQGPDVFDSVKSAASLTGFTAAALFTYAALMREPGNLRRLEWAWGIGGFATLAGLWLTAVPLMLGPDFQPQQDLRENNLPLLLPFMALFLRRRGGGWWTVGFPVTVTLSLAYVIIAQGRAALLGYLIALAGLWLARHPLRIWRALVSCIVMMIAATVILVVVFSIRGPGVDGWEYPIDGFSSGRTLLWRQALEHPPENPWIGVGIGNLEHNDTVLTMRWGNGALRVQHLHNFLLDAWYETGLLGLGALLVILAWPIGMIARRWWTLELRVRRRALIWLAPAVPVVAAALLSFSYTSRQFALYLFIMIGVGLYLAVQGNRLETSLADRQRPDDRMPL